ncbi:hypothetical protein JKP88DRAFT_289401 [Tribonema minus]|uniref:EF-hand domain-containing protein n=1 Tax=Tribonema minus TaxID=303371 RepID=A0A835Z1F4_9STRA|nr:hypothetical protein JKP88DRAFT_289401 [Tribonema minus]
MVEKAQQQATVLQLKNDILTEMVAAEQVNARLQQRRSEALKWELLRRGTSADKLAAIAREAPELGATLSRSAPLPPAPHNMSTAVEAMGALMDGPRRADVETALGARDRGGAGWLSAVDFKDALREAAPELPREGRQLLALRFAREEDDTVPYVEFLEFFKQRAARRHLQGAMTALRATASLSPPRCRRAPRAAAAAASSPFSASAPPGYFQPPPPSPPSGGGTRRMSAAAAAAKRRASGSGGGAAAAPFYDAARNPGDAEAAAALAAAPELECALASVRALGEGYRALLQGAADEAVDGSGDPDAGARVPTPVFAEALRRGGEALSRADRRALYAAFARDGAADVRGLLDAAWGGSSAQFVEPPLLPARRRSSGGRRATGGGGGDAMSDAADAAAGERGRRQSSSDAARRRSASGARRGDDEETVASQNMLAEHVRNRAALSVGIDLDARVMAQLTDVHEEMGTQAFVEAFEDADPNNYRAVYLEELVAVLSEIAPDITKQGAAALYAALLGDATGGIDYDDLAKECEERNGGGGAGTRPAFHVGDRVEARRQDARGGGGDAWARGTITAATAGHGVRARFTVALDGGGAHLRGVGIEDLRELVSMPSASPAASPARRRSSIVATVAAAARRLLSPQKAAAAAAEREAAQSQAQRQRRRRPGHRRGGSDDAGSNTVNSVSSAASEDDDDSAQEHDSHDDSGDAAAPVTPPPPRTAAAAHQRRRSGSSGWPRAAAAAQQPPPQQRRGSGAPQQRGTPSRRGSTAPLASSSPRMFFAESSAATTGRRGSGSGGSGSLKRELQGARLDGRGLEVYARRPSLSGSPPQAAARGGGGRRASGGG